MINLEYQIVTESSYIPSQQEMEQWLVQFVPEHTDATDIAIRVVDEKESQSLNSEYRGKDKPTNVLSFPFEKPEFLPADVEFSEMGDLIICAQIVEQEAAEQNKSLKAHWCHMIVHGTLHLLGYDHIKDADAEQMESLEIKILQKMGFPNPYIDQ